MSDSPSLSESSSAFMSISDDVVPDNSWRSRGHIWKIYKDLCEELGVERTLLSRWPKISTKDIEAELTLLRDSLNPVLKSVCSNVCKQRKQAQILDERIIHMERDIQILQQALNEANLASQSSWFSKMVQYFTVPDKNVISKVVSQSGRTVLNSCRPRKLR